MKLIRNGKGQVKKAAATNGNSETGFEVSFEGKMMYITINTAKELRESKSGKSTLVACSNGVVDVGKGLKLNLNLYK